MMPNMTTDVRNSVDAMAFREPVRSTVEPRLSSLIALHAIAIEADKQAWNSVSDTCEVLEANPAYIQPKVHTSSLLQWGPDGQESVPQYSSTEEEIRRDIGRHMDTALSLHAHPSLKAQYDAVKASYEQRIGRALEDLRQQMADYKRLEDEAGYTSALEHARSTKAAVIQAEKRIVEFVPSDWKEAAEKARWAAATYKDDHAYLYDQDNEGDVLVRILSTIGEIG